MYTVTEYTTSQNKRPFMLLDENGRPLMQWSKKLGRPGSNVHRFATREAAQKKADELNGGK